MERPRNTLPAANVDAILSSTRRKLVNIAATLMVDHAHARSDLNRTLNSMLTPEGIRMLDAAELGTLVAAIEAWMEEKVPLPSLPTTPQCQYTTSEASTGSCSVLAALSASSPIPSTHSAPAELPVLATPNLPACQPQDESPTLSPSGLSSSAKLKPKIKVTTSCQTQRSKLPGSQRGVTGLKPQSPGVWPHPDAKSSTDQMLRQDPTQTLSSPCTTRTSRVLFPAPVILTSNDLGPNRVPAHTHGPTWACVSSS